MKYLSFITACACSGLIVFSGCSKGSGSTLHPTNGGGDSATVTVVNGYGSGRYKVGDTVHIWSVGLPANTIFDVWTGYGSLLDNTGEWHNRFVMPASDVTVTGNQKAITPFTLHYEKIKGVNTLKNVFYFFPATQKGIVYLCHGTGGSAKDLVGNLEWMEMINDLVDAGYAIVVTEAEEVSLNTDLNGDGKIRWQLLPADTSANIDYANIRALTDTFYMRGYTQPSIARYSIGMSDGGAFSSALSFLYNYPAAISYCAPTSTLVTSGSVTPLQFCMAKNDNAPEVGPAGNATAQTNSSALLGRGICSDLFMHDRSPVYPQRWARRSDISLSTSAALYNELKSNQWLDSKSYLTAASDTISARILANPAAWPVTLGLNPSQMEFYTGELDIMYAAHQFYSDYNKTTIHFLGAPCH